MSRLHSNLENNPLWYKDAVIYQVHVKTFCDSNSDGVGDFKGLTSKLDYLKNLGINAIWLLPFYPSPLRDDGYDIDNYYDIHPNYGTLRDFKEFLRKAHNLGLRVVTELVINHTSDQHPWFKRAKKSKPGSNFRNYYVWNDAPDKFSDVRIIFKDFEISNWTWSKEANAYFWHRFYSHQPDLNFDNPNVQKEILRVTDFWFSIGVDGLRLDAVPYLFERDGTTCENLPETYAFLKKLRKYIDEKFDNRMLLAEANQWPEDAVKYFGNGDECHMAFHFPLMPRMYMGIQMEDRFPIIDILDQTPQIPHICQWALFLRNHDELTLEMVSDEERDYMYRTYAKDSRSRINLGIRRRLLPLMNNDRAKFELMNILLFSLPGTPIIYYGDEIGMGDNHFLGDRDGVRTPMQWSPDRNAGFSKANPQQLYLPAIIDSEYHYETVNVETQHKNVSSLLWWMKRIIATRKRYKAFSQGKISFLFPDNPKVLCFLREYEEENLLVIINLSRYSQSVDIDLKEYNGHIPKEVFSQNDFPIIKDIPYTVTLGPYTYFWFELVKQEINTVDTLEQTSEIALKKTWEEILSAKYFRRLETDILPQFVKRSRWFGGKAWKIRSIKVIDTIELTNQNNRAFFLILGVSYTIGNTETYLLPLSFVFTKEDNRIAQEFPESIICRLLINEEEGLLYDGACNQQVHQILFETMAKRKRFKCRDYTIVGKAGKEFKKLYGKNAELLSSTIFRVEQSNTSIVLGDLFFMKIFRRLDTGINPDIEISRYLTEKGKFKNIPAFAGCIESDHNSQDKMNLCILQQFIPSESSVWDYTQDNIKSFFELVLTQIHGFKRSKQKNEGNDDLNYPLKDIEINNKIKSVLINGHFFEMVRLLGQRTGQMHVKLAEDTGNPDFKTESFSLLYQRSLFQSMGSQKRLVFGLLKRLIPQLPESIQNLANHVYTLKPEIKTRLELITRKKYSAKKIRIHGDYHLGQVLFTGKDFIIIDFEGEPSKAISERRLKRSSLRDIAGMLRSFHYAINSILYLDKSQRAEDVSLLENAADIWYSCVCDIFIESYFTGIENADFLPKTKSELNILLHIFLLDKAIYELGYELNNRPDWLELPLRGICKVLRDFSVILSTKGEKDRKYDFSR
ncbi:MAG: maltose alpha-D-glucosyltransferase [Chitinispirillia bacterium]|jgi:maltose alpha-D-glucosyltransferase/alpha-amylase